METTAPETTVQIDGTTYVVLDHQTTESMRETIPNVARHMAARNVAAQLVVRRPKGGIWWQYFEIETARGPRYVRVCRVP